MKKRISLLLSVILLGITLCGCGEDPEIAKFKKDIDKFCTDISNLDTSMNQINANSEDAKDELLGYLDEVDANFKHFAELDFPDEFNYLESLADEAADYMTEAVTYYHESYSNGSYNEYTAAYAQENYARAFKRIQIIITFLHGEEPTDVDLAVEEVTEE